MGDVALALKEGAIMGKAAGMAISRQQVPTVDFNCCKDVEEVAGQLAAFQMGMLDGIDWTERDAQEVEKLLIIAVRLAAERISRLTAAPVG